MENVTIDGNEGDWEDFVKFDSGEEDNKSEQEEQSEEQKT